MGVNASLKELRRFASSTDKVPIGSEKKEIADLVKTYHLHCLMTTKHETTYSKLAPDEFISERCNSSVEHRWLCDNGYAKEIYGLILTLDRDKVVDLALSKSAYHVFYIWGNPKYYRDSLGIVGVDLHFDLKDVEFPEDYDLTGSGIRESQIFGLNDDRKVDEFLLDSIGGSLRNLCLNRRNVILYRNLGDGWRRYDPEKTYIHRSPSRMASNPSIRKGPGHSHESFARH